MLSLRAPAAGKISTMEQLLSGPRAKMLVPKITDGDTRKLVKEILNKPFMRSLARGAGRTAETTIEAMALDIMKGDDPLETAGYAAGVQASGSLALAATQGFGKGPGFTGVALRLAAASWAFGTVVQLLEDTIPGGEDSLIDSIEIGYEKV